MERALLVFYAVMSVLAFVCFGVDKRRAQKRKHRISEACLIGLGLLGGAVGALLGMHLFRHKTRHWYFYAFNLLFLAVQAVLWLAVRTK